MPAAQGDADPVTAVSPAGEPSPLAPLASILWWFRAWRKIWGTGVHRIFRGTRIFRAFVVNGAGGLVSGVVFVWNDL